MTDLYVTAEELKATRELKGQTFADQDIELAIAAASRGIDQLCGRRFWLDTDSTQVRYYTPVSRTLALTDDIETLTSLVIDQDGDGTFEQTWVENTHFTLEPLNAPADGWPQWRIRPHPRSSMGTLPRYPRSVKVTGAFGWPAVPDTVKQFAAILAGKLLLRSREAPFGIVTFGADAAARLARNDPDAPLLIGPYVKDVVIG
jgi:hypothetical protein